jgi:hypothetical protein
VTVTQPTETRETTGAAARGGQETGDAGPNWMLILICAITAVTAFWEALAVRPITGSDLWGYLLLGVGMALFAVQNFVWPRSRPLAGRFHIPAVALTLIGVVLLVLSNTAGRRI